MTAGPSERPSPPMRQILYLSRSSHPGNADDINAILQQSRHNNALDGITGLLWSDGASFLQAIEGPEASVALAFARIRADPRHHAIVVLQDRAIEAREYGGWDIALRTERDTPDRYDAAMARLLADVPAPVRRESLGLIATGHVASTAAPPRGHDASRDRESRP